jgi:AraC-like DNA-binding protein
MAPLAYAEYAPGAAVHDLALSYWCLTVRAVPSPDFTYALGPDGCLSVVVTLVNGEPVATPLLGPRRMPYPMPVTPGTQCWGIRFRPEMGAAFLGRPAASLRDQSGPAHHWLGGDRVRRLDRAVTQALAPFGTLAHSAAATAAVALALDRWLYDSADATTPPDQSIRDVVRAIVATEGKQQIAAIADVVGVSMRHLQRGFKDAVGLSPKEYAMIRRTRHALAAAEPGGATGGQLSSDVERLLRGTPEPLRQRLAQLQEGPDRRSAP